MRSLSVLFVATLGIAFAGCVDEQPTEPVPVPQEKWACYDDDDYHCLPEDQNPDLDPCPGCSGLYLGASYTLSACTLTELGNDADSDGMLDMCEYELAKGFAPLLATHPLDLDLTRETYWATAPGYSSLVKRTDGSEIHVDQADAKIIYLLGYHFDNGNKHECPYELSTSCDPHLGDSEFILLNVRYVDGRWRLSSMFTSAHWHTSPGLPGGLYDGTDYSALTTPVLLWDTGPVMYPLLQSGISFPAGNLRYPRVFVARDKHANYSSTRRCNDGGYNSSDDCDDNVDDQRVTVEYRRNVGSEIDPMLDRVASITGSPVFPGHEFMWSLGYGFCGWRVADDAPRHGDVCVGTEGEYGRVLRTFGF